MKFTCEIKMDNDVFEKGTELPSILKDIIKIIRLGEYGPTCGCWQTSVRDSKGNVVGTFSINETIYKGTRKKWQQ